MSHLLDTETTPKESAGLSILGEYQVMVLKGGSSANTRSFLTELGHVEGNPALTLGSVVNLIGFIHSDHSIVHLEKVCVLELGVISRRHNVALVVHNPEALHLFKRVGEGHLVGERVLEEAVVGLVHSGELSALDREQPPE